MPQAGTNSSGQFLYEGASDEEKENREGRLERQERNVSVDIGEGSGDGLGWPEYGGEEQPEYDVMSTGKPNPASRPSGPA